MKKAIPRAINIGKLVHKTSGNLNLLKMDMHRPKI